MVFLKGAKCMLCSDPQWEIRRKRMESWAGRAGFTMTQRRMRRQ